MKLPRILIVDDEEEYRELYRKILEKKTISTKSDLKAGSGFFDTGFGTHSIKAFFDDDIKIEIEEELSCNGYEIVEASQGQEAVEIIKKSIIENNPFSLIFLDIQMPPGSDGVQAAKAIRQLDNDIQIVIMTAYSNYTYAKIVETVESSDKLLFFKKPFKSAQILQLASVLTQHWFLERKALDQTNRK